MRLLMKRSILADFFFEKGDFSRLRGGRAATSPLLWIRVGLTWERRAFFFLKRWGKLKHSSTGGGDVLGHVQRRLDRNFEIETL